MAAEPDDWPGLSRVRLEPQLQRDLVLGYTDQAEEIRAELASRTWQWDNPYAVATR